MCATLIIFIGRSISSYVEVFSEQLYDKGLSVIRWWVSLGRPVYSTNKPDGVNI
jgi:hypothetical protein